MVHPVHWNINNGKITGRTTVDFQKIARNRSATTDSMRLATEFASYNKKYRENLILLDLKVINTVLSCGKTYLENWKRN